MLARSIDPAAPREPRRWRTSLRDNSPECGSRVGEPEIRIGLANGEYVPPWWPWEQSGADLFAIENAPAPHATCQTQENPRSGDSSTQYTSGDKIACRTIV